MTTDNQVAKSMISGGFTENLKSETPAVTAPAEDVLYADKTVETKTGDEKPAPTAEEQKVIDDKAAGDKVAADKVIADKAAADKAEADRIAAMTPEEKAAYEKEQADKKAAEDAEKAKKEEKKEPVDLSDMKMPEGFEAMPEVMAGLTEFVNEHGLTKEAAEKLAPLGALIAESAVAKVTAEMDTIRSNWREEIANDPVLGSKEQMAIANKGLEAYGSPELRKLLDETGLGDAPAVIRAFHKIGLTVKEDVVERGGSGDTRITSAADVMYPTMK